MVLTKAQLAAWRPLIPARSDLPAAPKRCILHWTAGSSKANSTDKQHYHYIFNQPDGEVVVGDHTVAMNLRQLGPGMKYAAHTGGFNSYSVGFAFAGHHFQNPDSNPLTEKQVLTGLAFVAYCMHLWGMPINEDTLFTHYEAWTIHKVKGTQNHLKTDITVLTFKPELGKDEVGPWLRKMAQAYLSHIERLVTCTCPNDICCPRGCHVPPVA